MRRYPVRPEAFQSQLPAVRTRMRMPGPVFFGPARNFNMLTTSIPLALGMPGLPEWIIIGAIGLLIFGKRLPEVGRSLGKGIVEFKKGLSGVEDEVRSGMVDEPANKRPA